MRKFKKLKKVIDKIESIEYYNNNSNDYYYQKGVRTLAGIKYSKQREAILTYLRSTKEHPTAEKVYSELRMEYPKISLGTVYRNLNLLADCGEILRLNCGDGTDHFDATIAPHYHFICEGCSRVLDLEMPSIEFIDEKAAENFDGKIKGHQVYFYGECKSCLSK